MPNKLSDSLTMTIGGKSQGSLLGLYGNKNVRGEMKREGERRVSGEHKYRVETKQCERETDSTNTKVVQLLRKEQRQKW